VVLLYANRDESSVIFAEELRALADKHPDRFVVVHWLESLQGLPTPAHVRAFGAPFATYDAFVCGPGPFMQGAVSALKELGFPRERRHQEKFVSLGGNPFGDDAEALAVEEPDEEVVAARLPLRDAPAEVVGVLDGREFAFDDWAPDSRLLDHLLAKGVDAPYSCREGACSACACRVLEGEVSMVHNEVLDAEDLEEGLRLACQSLPVSDRVRISYE
jgi:3-ketosteroid 9alpha-monooxygenase subunit B